MSEERGFLGSLFETSFARFVTVDIIRTVYVIQLALMIVAVALGDAYLIVQLLSPQHHGPAIELAFLLASPVVLLLGILLCRVSCELVMVVFRIAEELRTLRMRSGG